jgi:glutamyl-tRNA synthetase
LAKRHGAVGLPDRLARGESVSEVLAFLAASIGLADSDEPVTAGQLLARFDPVALAALAPLAPTLLSEEYLALQP